MNYHTCTYIHDPGVGEITRKLLSTIQKQLKLTRQVKLLRFVTQIAAPHIK